MKLKAANDLQIQTWIQQKRTFICFGAGSVLQELCQRTGLEKHIKWIADNNPGLWGSIYEIKGVKIPVKAPEQADFSGKEIGLLTTTYHMQVKQQVEELSNWNILDRAYYFPSQEDKNYMRFAWLLKRLKPQNKMIFRSGLERYVPGFDFSDNAKALFDYMITQGYDKTYKLIWYVHAPEDYPQLKSMKNVSAVCYEWGKSNSLKENFQYFYHLCTAKYLFFTDTHFWLRYCNKGQVRVNLWHGCGFKDRKGKGGPCGRNYDYMTVVSPLYADIHAKEYGVEREKVIDTGLAKEDLLFQPPKEKLSSLLHVAEAKTYVFWLPTFRMAAEGLERLNEYELDSDTGLPIITTRKKAEQLNCFLEEHDMVMIIKLHPVQRNSIISHLKLSRISVLENQDIASMGFQINTLLSKADALISDYSSVAVDYMLLDRPLAFMLEDVEQYQESRGFVFDNIHDYLPGAELYTYEDLEGFLADVAEGKDSTSEKRKRLIKKMHSHQDGNNCKRILEAVGIRKSEEKKA